MRWEVRNVYVDQLQGTGDGLWLHDGGGNEGCRHRIADAASANGTYGRLVRDRGDLSNRLLGRSSESRLIRDGYKDREGFPDL